MLTKKEYEILELRVKRGLTQVAVANKLGISQAAVSHFERSAFKKIKDSKKIIALANELKLSLETDDINFQSTKNESKNNKKKKL